MNLKDLCEVGIPPSAIQHNLSSSQVEELKVGARIILRDDSGNDAVAILLEDASSSRAFRCSYPFHMGSPTLIIDIQKPAKNTQHVRPEGSAKAAFKEFWLEYGNSISGRKELASLAFDAGHALRHKEELADPTESKEAKP